MKTETDKLMISLANTITSFLFHKNFIETKIIKILSNWEFTENSIGAYSTVVIELQGIYSRT